MKPNKKETNATNGLVRQRDFSEKKEEKNKEIYINPTFSPASVASTADYQAVYKLLKGHTVTNTVTSSERAELLDGTPDQIERLSKLPPCHQKKGMYVSLQETHAPTWRREAVSGFRSFVIEFDDRSIEEQKEIIDKSNLPFSFQVFSGNKSLHSFIVLDQPVSEKKHQEIAEVLAVIFPEADKSVLKTPNKLVRLPVVRQLQSAAS